MCQARIDPPEYDECPNCCGSPMCERADLCWCSASWCDACLACWEHCTCMEDDENVTDRRDCDGPDDGATR